MLLNEQKKQTLELYAYQFYTQQQIANAHSNKSAKPAIPETTNSKPKNEKNIDNQ